MVLYSYFRRPPRRPTVITDPGRTKQSFKDECDINVIFRKYVRTGEVPADLLNKRQAIFADVTDVPDYQEAMNIVRAAQEGFDALSAKVRDRFHNSPEELLGFLANPENLEEAQKLGLIPPGTAPAEQTPPTPSTGGGSGGVQPPKAP